MDLEEVRALPLADQMTILRGRILEAALSMEAVARYLHVRLAGGSELDAALDTPQQFRTLTRECRALADKCGWLNERTRPLVLAAVAKADEFYQLRNRFVHDLLHRSLTAEGSWERARLTRPKGEVGFPPPEPEPASAEEMIALVFALVETTWRLRGALWCSIGTSEEVSAYLTHPLDAQWDGSVGVVLASPPEANVQESDGVER